MSSKTEAEKFAERVERERAEWRAYQRNRRENCQYDGDWAQLISELNEMMK